MVSKIKKKNITWSDMKTKVKKLDHKQLVSLIRDLYRFSKENQSLLHARFSIGNDPLEPYKKTIKECMCPDIFDDNPIQISKAKKLISSYSKAVGDMQGEAELMTYFVECGNDYTLNYGDIDEPFYDALNNMYRNAIEKVLSLPEDQQIEFQKRLKKIMTSASNIGWCYHDMLEEDYYDAFPGDEDEDWEEGGK